LSPKEDAVSPSIPAVAYYRMSTDKQEASIPQQRDAVKAYAKVHGYRIVREYDQDEEIEVVRFLFHTYAESEVSLGALANTLNARGIPGPWSTPGRPSKWYSQSVKLILKNPHYVGDAEWGRVGVGKYHRAVNAGVEAVASRRKRQVNAQGLILVPDAHPAIVTRDIWEKVQQKLESRRTERHFPRQAGYVLSGILRCGHCGERMYGSGNLHRRPGKTYRYRRYLCGGYAIKGPERCKPHAIREDRILPFLVRKLQETYLAAPQLEALRQELRRKLAAKYQTSPGRVEGLRQKIAQLDAEIKQGARNLLRAGDNVDLLNEALSELRGQRQRFARELESLERAQAVPSQEIDAQVEAAVGALVCLREKLEQADPAALRRVFQEMISRVDLYFEPQPKVQRTWYRFTRGVVKLRPQLEVVGIGKHELPNVL
jgi:hypothetical protein